MEQQENSEFDLGKKVFFLYPPSVVKDELIKRLLEQEFEVYMLKDIATASTLLRRYPDSIVYINLDIGLPEYEWEKWIRALMENPVTKNVGIGIVSYNSDDRLQKKYLLEIGIRYGFIKLKLGLEESTRILIATLKASEVKGRRKYVRANCTHDTVSSLNIREGPTTSIGKISDISVVGFSCILDPDPQFQKNTILHDVQLKLKATLLRTEVIVFGSRVNSDQRTVYVMLFTKKIDDTAREKIRIYIQIALQTGIEMEASHAQPADPAVETRNTIEITTSDKVITSAQTTKVAETNNMDSGHGTIPDDLKSLLDE